MADTSSSKSTALVLAVAAILLGTLLWLSHTNTRLIPLCPLHLATGLYCPFCGGLRAAHLLLGGRLWDSFRMNPLIVLSLPLLALLAVRPRWARRKGLLVAAVALVFLYGIARNIPVWPFVMLAPP